ncbi:MAG: hypothetical protein ACR2N0_08630 [Rubrobacteraceae bacterium]
MANRNESPNAFSEAMWLANKDIRRAWLSYPASGIFILAISLLVASSVDGIFVMEGFGESGRGAEGFFNAFFADYMFLILGALLAVNSISMDYMRVWLDNDVFSHRLAFLRSLPASPGTLVASRAMSMLFAVPFTVPAFFIPIYFISDLGELGLSYVWFAGTWLGWSLILAGISLLGELAMSGKVYVWFTFVLVFGLIAALVLLEWIVEINLVGRAASLALEHGSIPAVVSLVIGGAAFALLARETKNRVERRELS